MTAPARNRLPLLGLLAVLGVLAGTLLSLRPARPAPGSPEVTFTQGMIQHHEQAVVMSRLIRTRDVHRAVKSLALDIDLSQAEQVRQMRGWLNLWNVIPGPEMTAEHARMMGMATDAELASLRTLRPAQAQVQFLQLMIRHHQGAVAMVDALPASGLHPEVSRLAGQVRMTQQGEIATMKGILKRLGADTSAAPAPMPEHQHH